jgi:hypothetical protein
MPSHNNASKESKHLCHRLVEELQHFLPDVARSESKDTCALYVPGRNRFAYVYHRSEAGLIRVYFRGNVSVAPALQKQLHVQVRPKVEKGWDKEFPYFIEINSAELLPAVANLINTNAYPLSEKKKEEKKQSSAIHLPEEIPQSLLPLVEGASKNISVNVYERNATARKICIAHYGCICQLCQFDFENNYGGLGEGIIHIHHLIPLAQIGEGYQVDPLADLIPVCPNCHAVIHRRNPPIDVETIRESIKKKAEQKFQPDRD